jgi:hypothetical protein
MELQDNQSALILESDEEGNITVSVASGDHDGVTGVLCQAIATKLIQDEEFQAELMEMLEEQETK